MLSFIRGRLTYANVVSTLCLFVVLGGGAYAATSTGSAVVHGCVAQDGTLEVVKAGHKCGRGEQALTLNKKGVAGVRGPAGQVGPTGPAGQTGSTGVQGPIGPSHAFSTSASSVTVASSSTVATLTLPAGSYSIVAKLWMNAENSGTYEWATSCTLGAGTDSDVSHVQSGATGGNDNDLPMSMAVLHTFAASGPVTVICSGSGATSLVAQNVVITATQVGALN